MNIIKRNGTEVKFDSKKIETAIKKANNSVSDKNKIDNKDVDKIVEKITNDIENSSYAHSVEDIQDMVEQELINLNKYQLAKNYIVYRYQHQMNRESSEFDAKINSIINDSNEEVKTENANKNPTILSTQRDYIAGEVSKEYSKKYIFSKEIIDAHNEGIIHIHDMDYAMMKSYNCSLINIDDMLQNGTIISGTKIDKPKSFTTACNVMTQIMAQVASSQYGGNAINIYHVSKFVDISRQKFIKKEKERVAKYGLTLSDEQFNSIIEDEVKEEIKKGVQMIQYQINTLMTTNGQTPFSSLFMYINDAETDIEKHDHAMVIEEILNQRILGVKNKVGVYVAPPFPKLLYVLDDNNITEDSEYWYLTKLAAECTAKRMVPDYISAKKMRELKDGNVFGCINKHPVHHESDLINKKTCLNGERVSQPTVLNSYFRINA